MYLLILLMHLLLLNKKDHHIQVFLRRNQMQSEATSHTGIPQQCKIRENLKPPAVSGCIPYLTTPSTQVFIQALPVRKQKLLC